MITHHSTHRNIMCIIIIICGSPASVRWWRITGCIPGPHLAIGPIFSCMSGRFWPLVCSVVVVLVTAALTCLLSSRRRRLLEKEDELKEKRDALNNPVGLTEYYVHMFKEKDKQANPHHSLATRWRRRWRWRRRRWLIDWWWNRRCRRQQYGWRTVVTFLLLLTVWLKDRRNIWPQARQYAETHEDYEFLLALQRKFVEALATRNQSAQ